MTLSRRTTLRGAAAIWLAAVAAPAWAETSDAALAARLCEAMAQAQAMSVQAMFPRKYAVGEIAKAIRRVLYATDLTPARMTAVLDALPAAELTTFELEAVDIVRQEIALG